MRILALGSMNPSITIRLPGLATPAEDDQSTASISSSDPTSEISDEALMLQVSGGSREALAMLFRRYARVVRGVSYRVLRDTSEADDLVQDVFLLVHRDCKTYDSSKSPVRFWILQMAYRRAISRRRYLTSRHFYTRLDLNDATVESTIPQNRLCNINDLMDENVENKDLNRIFDELSENQRQTLRLFFIHGYTLDEIAAKLGQSRGNVKHHYFRGLERLRKELFGSKLPGGRAV
jgi:RNA polymerase sigma-70 factor (ECF subfamily)